ncbi:hypothetical protein WN51_13266 [Melipona quadrifasciata]|uniref:Uncharacterized protein n=1 Tax=Melipona quadrifasciata TaxID=166423 RepID=A0A0M9A152_9HYME|nr:hypothetical protein WN51_13266 [Melipona quadrifasciata]
MEDFCPLCLKKGIKNEIKLFQINLEEGVWLCKDEECVWPFGYKDFAFCPRPVGKVWSCYWDDYKPSNCKEKVTTSSPSKSALCHASTISTQNTEMIEMTNNSDIHCLKNINNISSSSNVTYSKTGFNNLHISGVEEPSIIPNIDIEKDSSKNILNKKITATDTNVHKSNLQSVGNNIKVENELINSLNKRIKEKDDIFTANNENINNVRRTPKIISIENTNIDTSSMKLASQTSNIKLKNEISVHQKSADVTEIELKSEVEKLEPSEDNKNILKPNLNTTTMEIDGLPITLSFEVPVCTTTPKTVIANTQLTNYENNDTISNNNNNKNNNNELNNSKMKNTFVKRNITSGKQYEKFNFSVIKKNVESNNFNNNNSSNMKKTQIQKVKNDSPEIISNVNVNISVPNQFNKSKTRLSSQKHKTSDAVPVNISTNIDTVLDSLTKNSNTSAQDDEWILSLLQ